MTGELKILFVEDVKTDVELICRELEKNNISFSKLLVNTREQYLESLKTFEPDLIISDYSLPQLDGMTTLLLRNELAPLIPFILVTGSINEEVAVECIKNGADDYILKENLSRLVPAIINSINKFKMIADRRQVEEKAEVAISQERRMLRTLIDNLPDPIYVKDKDLRKVIANKADVENIGFASEAEVLGKTDIELFPGTIGERGYNDDIKVMNSGKPEIDLEEEFINAMGVKRWLQTSKIPLQDKDGNITGLVGIGHDITERKRVETELQHSYIFNKSLLSTIPFGMDIVDESGNVLFQSDNFKSLVGDQNEGSKCWELYKDDKKQCLGCPLLNGIAIGETAIYESHGVLGNRIYEINHTGMMYQGKKAILEIFQDITERKQNEEELIRAKEKAEESDKLKTAFLHNISHEIRTPLNAIVGFSALLAESETDAKERDSYIGVLLQSSDHLLSIIADIVEISNIDANLIKTLKNEININSIIESLCNQFLPKALEKKIKLNCETGLSDIEALIFIDNAKLHQILSNLISNAFKFTENGQVNISYTLRDNFLEFNVSDTGIGILREHHARIFDRFYQVQNTISRLYEGTGLGLAISKAYVEHLGGRIWLTSEFGKGATFFFTIPYEKRQATGVPVTEKKTGDILVFPVKKIILVAEDVESNFKLIQHFLSESNVEILYAVNGKEAVEKCLTNGKIDLILMDIKMPVMDGYTAVKIIREKNKDIPIIAQTAYADDMQKAIECGCSGFISKPFNKKSLFKVLSEFIN